VQIDHLTLVLALLGAFWTGTSAVFTGMDAIAKTRDKIVTGRADDEALALSYRRHMLLFDWLPLKLALASVSLVLGVTISLLPRLATPAAATGLFTIICRIAAFVPFAGALTFMITTPIEWRMLSRRIGSAHRDEKEVAKANDEKKA